VGGGGEQVPAAEKASDEGMVKAKTKQRRSNTERQGRAVTTEASADDRGAPAKAADATSAVDPEVEGDPTREPPAMAEKVETSRGDDAGDPSGSAARRDPSSEQEDRSRPTEDAAAEK
jgi:hypothetical protein